MTYFAVGLGAVFAGTAAFFGAGSSSLESSEDAVFLAGVVVLGGDALAGAATFLGASSSESDELDSLAFLEGT